MTEETRDGGATAAAEDDDLRAHRWAVRSLLVIATALAVVSIFAVWANRQLLSASNWADTSSKLLEQPAIQSQVAGYVVDQVYANTDVSAQIAGALPPRFKPLAGPAANGLRNLAERSTTTALGRPRIQEAWRTANYITANQLIRTIKGQSKVAKINGNAVILDLRPIVLEIAARLGLPSSLTSKIPPSAAQIHVMSADQLSTLQNGAKALGALATVLPILALGCLALAVFLARGRRRRILLWAGIDLVIAGVMALIARRLVGEHVVSALATTEAVKPAAEATWTIGTAMLKDVAQATIIGGIPLIIAALLAGPSRPALAFRRAAAPWLRDRPAIVYGIEAALVLLVVAWGPIPATRKPLPVLVMAALLVLGVEVLRRQTAREFPEVTAAESRAAVAARLRTAGATLSTSRRLSDGESKPTVTVTEQDPLAQLERLAELHDRGVLTDSEFTAQKAALLAR